jgi:hypothetical protein
MAKTFLRLAAEVLGGTGYTIFFIGVSSLRLRDFECRSKGALLRGLLRLLIDGGVRQLGEGLVGVLLLSQGLIEQPDRLLESELRRIKNRSENEILIIDKQRFALPRKIERIGRVVL